MTIFTVRDLRRVLEQFSLTRRKAILFCLDNDTPPEQLLTLTWQGVFKYPLTAVARDIVRSMPRHLRLPYVFWEYVPNGSGIAAPLFGLEASLVENTGYNYDQLAELYRDMLMVDEDLDAAVFAAAIKETFRACG